MSASTSASTKLILFEPWNMGDALIALAIALQAPGHITLACNTRWHPLIRAAAEATGTTCPELLPANLDYTSRTRTGRFDFGSLAPIATSASSVATIRGDIRDCLAAKKLFPHASIHTSGWLVFAARRAALLDLPYAKGWLPIRNRYRAWATLASIPWPQIETFYNQRAQSSRTPLITIHIGAQWHSRQYPHTAKLAALLSQTTPIQIIGGPNDPLPTGISEDDILRLTDQRLIDAFRASSLVLVNDSGPMHLAALLRCRTYPLTRISAIAEWLPPATTPIEATSAPRGYRPHPAYKSDSAVEGWPSPQEILRHLT
jgi:hypothetical protein